MIDLAMVQQCAVDVAPQTVLEIIRAESDNNPLALNINGVGKVLAKDLDDAVAQAEKALKTGYSVDIGLMQVNSRHLPEMHVTVRQAFDPCTNLKMGADVLIGHYVVAAKMYGPGQVALQHALSAYNTGDYNKGLQNGYVAQYYGVQAATAAAAELINPYSADTLVYDLAQPAPAAPAAVAPPAIPVKQPEPATPAPPAIAQQGDKTGTPAPVANLFAIPVLAGDGEAMSNPTQGDFSPTVTLGVSLIEACNKARVVEVRAWSGPKSSDADRKLAAMQADLAVRFLTQHGIAESKVTRVADFHKQDTDGLGVEVKAVVEPPLVVANDSASAAHE